MARVNKLRTARKALLRGAQYAAVAVAALASVPVPEDVTTSDQAAVVFALAVGGAILKAIQNYHKTSKRPVGLGSRTGYMLAVAGLVGLLAGCVTTTAPDGTVVQSVDLDTAWGAYERLQAERTRLEAERDTAAVQERALIEAEIRRLESEIRAAWAEVLDRYQ